MAAVVHVVAHVAQVLSGAAVDIAPGPCVEAAYRIDRLSAPAAAVAAHARADGVLPGLVPDERPGRPEMENDLSAQPQVERLAAVRPAVQLFRPQGLGHDFGTFSFSTFFARIKRHWEILSDCRPAFMPSRISTASRRMYRTIRFRSSTRPSRSASIVSWLICAPQ